MFAKAQILEYGEPISLVLKIAKPGLSQRFSPFGKPNAMR